MEERGMGDPGESKNYLYLITGSSDPITKNNHGEQAIQSGY